MHAWTFLKGTFLYSFTQLHGIPNLYAFFFNYYSVEHKRRFKKKKCISVFSYKKANGVQYSFTPHWHSLNGQKLWKQVFSNMDTWLSLPFISNQSFFLHTFYVNHFLLARILRQNPKKIGSYGDKMTKMLWFHNFILHVHLQHTLNNSVTRERFQWHICGDFFIS